MRPKFGKRLSSCVVFLGISLSFVAGCSRQQVDLPPLDSTFAPPEERIATDYKIQPGDTLRIKYLYHPELNVKVPVSPGGDITLDVAGLVHATGLTPTELEEVIKDRSSHRLRDPEINVTIGNLGDRTVWVGGEVRAPGAVTYREGMTPLQAIMERGGFLPSARIDSVLRLSKNQGTRLDFTKPLTHGTPEGLELSVNDVIYVPRTFIGDVNIFVQQYIRGVLPIEPRVGWGSTF